MLYFKAIWFLEYFATLKFYFEREVNYLKLFNVLMIGVVVTQLYLAKKFWFTSTPLIIEHQIFIKVIIIINSSFKFEVCTSKYFERYFYS